MPISRSQMPRQMYGLGSFVKSIGKGIKKIVKSPIGKAAILGFGANALMPGGLSSLFSGGGGLTGLFSKAKGLYDGLSGVQKIGGALALGGAFGGMEDQQIEELKANPEALANYLRQYYSNLNQDATPTQIEEFVQRNMKAGGGRIGSAVQAHKESGFNGVILRCDCLPGYRMNPDLDFVKNFWGAAIGDLKSTKSKNFNFRSKVALERDIPMEWFKYQKSVMESGALGGNEPGANPLDSANGDYQGF